MQSSPVQTSFRNSIEANNGSLPESNGLKSHFNSENIVSSSNLCSSIGSSLSNVNNSNSIDRSNKDDLSVIRSSLNLPATSGHIPRTSSEQPAWCGPTTSVESIPSIDRNQPSWSGYDNVMDLREAIALSRKENGHPDTGSLKPLKTQSSSELNSESTTSAHGLSRSPDSTTSHFQSLSDIDKREKFANRNGTTENSVSESRKTAKWR